MLTYCVQVIDIKNTQEYVRKWTDEHSEEDGEEGKKKSLLF